jgi:hypothetical protein
MAGPIQIGAPDGSIVEFPGGTSDDVIKSAMAKAYPPPPQASAAVTPQATSDRPSVAADVAKSGGIGVVKGGLGLLGSLGDLTDLGAKGIEKASNFVSDRLGVDRYQRPAAPSILQNIPTAGSLQKNVEGVTGEFYQPKTTAGEYAQTAGEFLPGMIGGPEGIASRLATRVAAPAVASETAGQLTQGTAAEPYARIAGALLSPVATSAAARGVASLQSPIAGMSRASAGHLIAGVEADGPAAVQARLAALGPDATMADAGPALLGKAQGAALNSDEGRSILQGTLTARNEGTNQRIMGDVNRALGPAEDPQTVTDAIRAHRSAVDTVNYPAALDNAPQVQVAPILHQIDARIAETPVGSMEHRALTNARAMMMTTERRPLLDAAGNPQYDNLGNQRWTEVPVSQNDANVLHRVKGELDNVISYDAPGLGVPAGALQRQQGALKQVRGALNAELESQVPGYADANRASAALAQRAEAVGQGTQYLGSGKTTPSPDRFAAEFGQLSPGEQIAFAKGSRGNIERVLGTKANDLQALRGELQGEGGWNTAKIATVHGQPSADELVSTVDRNLKFRDTYNKVVENSQTAQRTAAAKAMKPDPSTETPLFNPNSTLTGMAATLGKKGVQKVLDAILTSDPTKHYGEVARALTEQGSARDARLMSIIDAINSRGALNAATSAPLTAKQALIAAMLARQSAGTDVRNQ